MKLRTLLFVLIPGAALAALLLVGMPSYHGDLAWEQHQPVWNTHLSANVSQEQFIEYDDEEYVRQDLAVAGIQMSSALRLSGSEAAKSCSFFSDM